MADNISVDNRRIAKNTMMLSVRMIFVLCINLYTTRVTLDVLGIDDFGIYNVVCGFVSMFTFLNTSMSNGIQRFFNYELQKNGIVGARRVYITSILIQTLLLIIILLLTESIGLWYLYNKMVIPLERFDAALWVFQCSLISFVFVIMQVPYNAAMMAHERMNYYALISVLDSMLKLLVVVLISYAKSDLLILYGIFLSIISFLNYILAFIYAKRNFNEINFRFHYYDKLFKSMLSFSGWNIFGTFSNMMREQGLNMVLNLFFGPIVNAARGVSYQVSAGLQSFVSNVNIAIRPQIVQSYAKGDINRTISLMFSLSKIGVCALFIIAYPVLLEIDYILNLWLDGNIPEYTSSFVVIVVLIAFINNLNSAVSSVVHASGKMKKYQLIGSLITLSSLPFAYYVLTLGYNPNSVFWVSLIFTILMQSMSLFILKSIITFSIYQYIKQVILPFILVVMASVVFPLIPYFLFQTGFLRFVLVVSVAVVFSSIALYIVGLNSNERLLIKSFINKVKCFKKI